MINNLKIIREQKSLSVRGLAKLANLSATQISDLENKKSHFSHSSLQKIASALDVKPEDLIKDNTDHDNLVVIKLYKHILPTNNAVIDLEKEQFEPLQISKDYITQITNTNPDNLIAIKARGNSMEPEIYGNDIVFIDKNTTTSKDDSFKEGGFREDGIYAFYYNNELYLKRIQRQSDSYLIISDNPNYSPWNIPLPPKYNLQIIGLVKGKLGKMV